MKRLVFAVSFLVAAFALISCQSKSPSSPDTNTEREQFCFDHVDQCSWFDAGFVKLYGRPTVVSGARGIVIQNMTQEPHSFQTDFTGGTESILWERGYVPNKTSLWVTIDSGTVGGIAYDRYDKKDIVPTCTAHLSITRGMICQWTAELVTAGPVAGK